MGMSCLMGDKKMIDNKVIFSLEYREHDQRYVLNIRVKDGYNWVIKVWDSKPSKKLVEETKGLILRSFLFYHNHLFIPKFDVKEEVMQ